MQGDGTSGGPAGSQRSMLVTGGANGLGADIARFAADPRRPLCRSSTSSRPTGSNLGPTSGRACRLGQ